MNGPSTIGSLITVKLPFSCGGLPLNSTFGQLALLLLVCQGLWHFFLLLGLCVYNLRAKSASWGSFPVRRGLGVCGKSMLGFEVKQT